MSIAQRNEIEALKQRVAVLERQERAHHDAIDKLLELLPPQPAPRETLTLPEKRKSA